MQAICRMFAGNGDGAMETFGQRLRGFRKASGLHQEELAAHIGLPTTAISKIENGTRDVTLAEAQALARVLHMDLGTLAGRGARQYTPPAGPDLLRRGQARRHWALAWSGGCTRSGSAGCSRA